MSEEEDRIVTIAVCSKCDSHAWCTRHDEAAYLKLANELKTAIETAGRKWDLIVRIQLVSGSKMGSFEVTFENHLFFSKLALGYFPHVTLLTERIVQYLDDVDEGIIDPRDFRTSNYSPIKEHSHIVASPKKKTADPKSPYLKGNPKASKASPTAQKKKPSPQPQPACSAPPPSAPKE